MISSGETTTVDPDPTNENVVETSASSSSSTQSTTMTTMTTVEAPENQEQKLDATATQVNGDAPKIEKDTDNDNNNDNANDGSSEVSIARITAGLQQTQADFDARLAALETAAQAEALRREFLGKKGPLNAYMSQMRLLSAEEKPLLGVVVNQVKTHIETAMSSKLQALKLADLERQMEHDRVDVTMPGLRRFARIGRRHPLSMTMEKALDVFVSLGYDTVTSVEDSPEMETDYYCFEALNCPKDHPARDMQDTFYLTPDRELLLRTHTSAVQIRQLEQRKPPLRIVAPGRVYRKDDIDATHSLCFHQVEILALERTGELTLGHLKGTVEYFLQQMFGPDIQVRFRGSYFPFTEPSMEVDVFFRGKWLEVLGCGMVDPAVLEKAGIDPEEYGGFAAGFGIERFAMVMHGITDLREFYKNDVRFLQQFPHFYDDGMISFLSGEARTDTKEEEEDIRGIEVPDPYVESMEELRALKKRAEQQQQQRQTANEGSSTTESSSKEDSGDSPAPPGQEASDMIDISKLDLRVGVIQKAWEHPEADKLFCELIDIGEEEPRQIASGLRAYYQADELVGKRVLVLANLKARKLMGFPSHGMVLCATSSEEGQQVQLVEAPAHAPIGERVTAPGYDGPPATENQVLKKKMLDEIFPHLKTNADGVACYKGVPLETSSAGPCLPTSLPNAQVS
ncbi:hypothetical protein ACA910_007477 [Epithemia clementina (nom. ined.)]